MYYLDKMIMLPRETHVEIQPMSLFKVLFTDTTGAEDYTQHDVAWADESKHDAFRLKLKKVVGGDFGKKDKLGKTGAENLLKNCRPMAAKMKTRLSAKHRDRLLIDDLYTSACMW